MLESCNENDPLDKTDAFRSFLAYKSAQEALDELGVLGRLDKDTEAAIASVFASMIKSGMLLSLQENTTREAIDNESQRLSDELLPQIRQLLIPYLPTMIHRGIDLHRNEMVPGTEKIRGWTDEYELIDPIDTE